MYSNVLVRVKQGGNERCFVGLGEIKLSFYDTLAFILLIRLHITTRGTQTRDTPTLYKRTLSGWVGGDFSTALVEISLDARNGPANRNACEYSKASGELLPQTDRQTDR